MVKVIASVFGSVPISSSKLNLRSRPVIDWQRNAAIILGAIYRHTYNLV